jgi:hypothetical protein
MLNRKDDIMKNPNVLLLIVFLLSSCVPTATTVPTFTAQSTETITPSPTATQTPSPTPTITPIPTQIGGGSGKLIFEYYKAAYEKEFPDLKGEVNIFISNWDGTNLTPITNGLNGFNRIISISPDGKMILVSSRSSFLGKDALYLINLSSTNNAPTKLANELDGRAIFLDNARIVYIGKGSQSYGFYTVNIDGTNPKKIGAPTGKTARIVSSDKTRIYYTSSIKKEYFRDSSGSLYAYGDYGGLWWTNIDGSGQGKLESNGHQIFPGGFFPSGIGEGVAFSPDGTKIAWIPAEVEQGCSGALGTFWTPDIRNDTYTEYVGRASQFLPKDSPYFGKVVDIPFVEDYVRRCNIVHVAPLSDMDNDTKIPLIPPLDPAKDEFYYHRDYVLRWWPDSSKILAYDAGHIEYSTTGRVPIAIYEIVPEDTNPQLVLLKVLSYSSVVQPGPGAQPHLADNFTLFRFSPDGHQLLFAKYNPFENFYSAYVNILNLETMNFVDSFGSNITPDTQVKRVGSIYWLP